MPNPYGRAQRFASPDAVTRLGGGYSAPSGLPTSPFPPRAVAMPRALMAARASAIDVIERSSGVLFTSEDRAALLLHKPVLTKTLDPTLSREGRELIEKWYQKVVPTVPER
jgi:hypothetical protein